ncbi:uncharacterized protein LOC134212598 [Armigeres subalbatus]|uniref:uncharacterized protein LOC134212598 n=1 Tax=Armigeres subalbatus TaxID=124917 RepID=UPI002ED03D32
MKCLQLTFFTLCIIVKAHLSESFPQCCPAMCCSCGCGSMQRSSDEPADPAINDGQQSAEDLQRSPLPKKSHYKVDRGKETPWDKTRTVINGAEAVLDVVNFIKENVPMFKKKQETKAPELGTNSTTSISGRN